MHGFVSRAVFLLRGRAIAFLRERELVVSPADDMRRGASIILKLHSPVAGMALQKVSERRLRLNSSALPSNPRTWTELTVVYCRTLVVAAERESNVMVFRAGVSENKPLTTFRGRVIGSTCAEDGSALFAVASGDVLSIVRISEDGVSAMREVRVTGRPVRAKFLQSDDILLVKESDKGWFLERLSSTDGALERKSLLIGCRPRRLRASRGLLAVACEDGLRIVDLEEFRILGEARVRGGVTDVSVSGKRIIATVGEGLSAPYLLVLSAEGGEVREVLHYKMLRPRLKKLPKKPEDVLAYRNGYLHLLKVSKESVNVVDSIKLGGAMRKFALSGRARVVATLVEDGEKSWLEVYSYGNQRFEKIGMFDGVYIEDLAISEDGRLIAASDEWKRIVILRASNGLKAIFDREYDFSPFTIGVAPDGSYALFIGSCGYDQEALAVFYVTEEGVEQIAKLLLWPSPSGFSLACDSSTAVVYDLGSRGGAVELTFLSGWMMLPVYLETKINDIVAVYCSAYRKLVIGRSGSGLLVDVLRGSEPEASGVVKKLLVRRTHEGRSLLLAVVSKRKGRVRSFVAWAKLVGRRLEELRLWRTKGEIMDMIVTGDEVRVLISSDRGLAVKKLSLSRNRKGQDSNGRA